MSPVTILPLPCGLPCGEFEIDVVPSETDSANKIMSNVLPSWVLENSIFRLPVAVISVLSVVELLLGGRFAVCTS